ncbi:MAG: hypothetical protein JXR49_09795 [Acidobacteria bacterium]|nr:hypothetical protein [Acidobacteriota bacterium]
MKAARTKTGSRQTMYCLGIVLIGTLLTIPLQNLLIAHLNDTGPDPDLLYLNSPKILKKMALGYDSLLADIYWLRTIQYFGDRKEAEKRTVRFKNLYTLLDITTTLDPDLIDAYQAGCIFLAEDEPVGAGLPGEALKLLDKGIEVHPEEWRLRYDKGFIYYWFLSDFKSAGDVWLEVSRRPEAPEEMGPLAAMALSQGGAMNVARSLWKRQYDESTRKGIRENARNRLLSLQVAEDLWTLEYLLGVYRLENEKYPGSLEALLSGESRKVMTVDPLGTPYDYDPETGAVKLNPQTKVHYVAVPMRYKEDFLTTLAD